VAFPAPLPTVSRYRERYVDESREQVVHHRAGLDGKGRSEYLSRVILRERDTTGASPDTLDERVYYLYNWRSDVIGVLSSAGEQLESVRYSAYGVPFLLAAGDVKETFGVIDLQDVGQFTSWINTSTYDVRGDLDLDGDVDSANGALIKSSTGGRGVLSHPDTDNRLGYAGYVGEPDLSGTVWHVRNRVLNSDLGRWLARDPMGYRDGLDMNAYARVAPVMNTDPMGLAAVWGAGFTGGFRECDPILSGGCGSASGSCVVANLNLVCQPGGGGNSEPEPEWIDCHDMFGPPATPDQLLCSSVCPSPYAGEGAGAIIWCHEGRRLMCDCRCVTTTGDSEFEDHYRECRRRHEEHNWEVSTCAYWVPTSGSPRRRRGVTPLDSQCNEGEAYEIMADCLYNAPCNSARSCY